MDTDPTQEPGIVTRRFGIRASRVLAGLLLAVLTWPVPGAETLEAAVEHNAGRFSLYAVSLIDLPEPRVRATLTHYENLPRVNGGIQAVEVLRRDPDGGVRMGVRSRVCILFICQHYRWEQEVRTQSDGTILAVIDPRASDFRDGWARWRLTPVGQRTRLVFDAELVPDFWFPPLIGPWLIKRKLYGEVLETAQGVERLAAGNP